jgi:hypothetical protein
VAQAAHVALDNRAMWQTCEEQPDGSLIVTLTLPDLQWAACMALGYGPIVTVLQPQELRHLAREWAQARGCLNCSARRLEPWLSTWASWANSPPGRPSSPTITWTCSPGHRGGLCVRQAVAGQG